jgi:Alkylmercury lyase
VTHPAQGSPTTESGCDEDLLRGLDGGVEAREFVLRGFVALWRGARPTIGELTERAEIVDALLRVGRVEVDDDGVVVGVHGLVARATPHRIEHADGVVHTWCALDAIGIPAALGIDATARTSCPACGAGLAADLRGGQPVGAEALRLWIPGGACSHMVEDFCRYANLYCDAEHLGTAPPPGSCGQAVGVAEAASIGCAAWRDAAAALRTATSPASVPRSRILTSRPTTRRHDFP